MIFPSFHNTKRCPIGRHLMHQQMIGGGHNEPWKTLVTICSAEEKTACTHINWSGAPSLFYCSPQVLLQLASGAFPLDTALCDAISVPMDKLKWTSPFNSHRTSLGHLSHSSSRRAESADDGRRSLCEPETNQQPAEHIVGNHSPSHLSRSAWMVDAGSSSFGSAATTAEPQLSPHSEVDSGRGSGSGGLETASPSWALKRKLDPESMVWATAVALAWLEHSSASYFIEWEMVAAKASMWLSAQDIPEGRDLASIKAAANQLFIILRHWDENLQLNMLCYNPNSVWGLLVQDWKYRPLKGLNSIWYYANWGCTILCSAVCPLESDIAVQLWTMCIFLCSCAVPLNISQALQRHYVQAITSLVPYTVAGSPLARDLIRAMWQIWFHGEERQC